MRMQYILQYYLWKYFLYFMSVYCCKFKENLPIRKILLQTYDEMVND